MRCFLWKEVVNTLLLHRKFPVMTAGRFHLPQVKCNSNRCYLHLLFLGFWCPDGFCIKTFANILCLRVCRWTTTVTFRLVQASLRAKGAQLFWDSESIWLPQINKNLKKKWLHTHATPTPADLTPTLTQSFPVNHNVISKHKLFWRVC